VRQQSSSGLQDKIEFWNNVYGFKMGPIKTLALQEPLVDSVSHECVNTSADKLISVDINSMAASDIPFDSPFELKVLRNDHIHAFVMWFDIFFDCSHKPVSFLATAAQPDAYVPGTALVCGFAEPGVPALCRQKIS
jgi:hypothetical protein